MRLQGLQFSKEELQQVWYEVWVNHANTNEFALLASYTSLEEAHIRENQFLKRFEDFFKLEAIIRTSKVLTSEDLR